MKYSMRKDKYCCNVLNDNFREIDGRLSDLEENGGGSGGGGKDGKDGVSVLSVEQTTTSVVDGGTNLVTCTLSDGTESTFEIRNGNKGSDGKNGNDGKSAYQYAVDGGYTGTEEEFMEKLANDSNVIIVDNLSETVKGKALDATQGAVLNEKIADVNDKIEDIEGRIDSGSGGGDFPYVIGSFASGTVEANSYKDITVNVDFGFTPSTIVFTEDMSTNTRIATFDYALLSLSSTSFKVRAKNYHTSGGNTRDVRYIAFK